MNLPELRGSPKQIAWANDLRTKEIDGLLRGLSSWPAIRDNPLRRSLIEAEELGLLADSLEEDVGPEHTTIVLIRQFLETLKRETHSRYWIDTRNPIQ